MRKEDKAGSISLESALRGERRFERYGEASGKRDEEDSPFRSRKGFGYRVMQEKARPSNTSIRDLLADSRYTEAVSEFLAATRVGEVKAGSICI